jgi:hypothetical protein
MPGVVLRCLTIVAAFHLSAGVAAAQVMEDVPVPAPMADLARSVGRDPAQNPALLLPDLVRIVYARVPEDARVSGPVARPARVPPGRSDLIVPVPLTTEVWGRAVFGRSIRREHLFAEIVTDQRSALLAHGLFGLDDRTLGYLAGERDVLRRLRDRSPAAFAVFAESLRVVDGRVQVPGGDAAVALWEALVGQRVTSPAAFVPALYERERGRLAYLYDLVDKADAPHRAFLLGTWLPAEARQARFQALASAVVRAYQEWRIEEAPFSRPVSDLSVLIARLKVTPSGVPSGPASRAFWMAATGSDDPLAAGGMDLAGGPPVDAAWFIEFTGPLNTQLRGERLDQIAFVQRVFGDVGSGEFPDTVVAARAFRRYRGLLMAFEWLGARSPAVYADAARRMASRPDGDPDTQFWTHAQIQGALALLVHMRRSGGLEARAAEALAASLCAIPVDRQARLNGGVARWLVDELLPLLPSGPHAEARVIAALAGPRETHARRVTWEGAGYRLDLRAAEATRLGKVRSRQASFTLDLALALAAARDLAARGRPEDLTAAAAALTAILDEHAPAVARATPTTVGPDVRPVADLGPRLREAVARLGALASAARNADLGIAAWLTETADVVLGEALLSMAYATGLGDPEGTALLGRNVALRHNFGLTHPSADMRERLPWSLPVQHVQPGIAWHVIGSLVGLDLALAPLALKRISLDPLEAPPRLPTNERDAFALGVALMDPLRLRDVDRDAIAAAIERGQKRVMGLPGGRETLGRVSSELDMDPRRRRALAWMLGHDDTGTIGELFSLGELLALGGVPAGVDLDAWGPAALASYGCACTALMPPGRWRLVDGRPQAGLLASAMPDLTLRIALELKALGVPAALARHVLSLATLPYTESVAPTDLQDWRALSRAAQAVPRARVEDYVAAATAPGGPLVPDAGGTPVP